MSQQVLQVTTFIENKIISVPFGPTTTAEDVCIHACKQLNIGPIARHLFNLYVPTKKYFLTAPATFNGKMTQFELRFRFKVPDVLVLQRIDYKAFEYYFYQVRSDVLNSRMPEEIYDVARREMIGLGITDMYRVMMERGVSRESVESEYRKYIPKEVFRKHLFFIKKPIHDTLVKLQKGSRDARFVISEYVQQVDSIAPEYLVETYKGITDMDGSSYCIKIRVHPYHPTEPGIQFCMETEKDEWRRICSIEDLAFVSIGDDNCIEISRRNGRPFYLKLTNQQQMLSFIGLIDGYYRLTCKWTFNICKDVQTPSLQRLHSMKCHGPVGGEFSYAKLDIKRGYRPGCFIIRESETKYNSYFVDVCMKINQRVNTYKIERLTANEFIFNNDLTRYQNIKQLMAAYQDPEGPIYLQEIVPPTEYDISPLLLCRAGSDSTDALTDFSSLSQILENTGPRCIQGRELQVYKGMKKGGFSGMTYVNKALWKVVKGKRTEVAMKMLESEHMDKYLKVFLDQANQYLSLSSSAVVKLFGISLTSNISIVMEFFRLGPLDKYLRENKARIKQEDLVEAASNLATALYHLKENEMVHGRVRCRKLMVHKHEETSFAVKLMDPGINITYASNEVHWIPVECYSNLDYAKRSTPADMWAMATTLWEIFTFGEEIKTPDYIEVMNLYASGKRLARPPSCPPEIYQLMRACWNADPYERKQPQAASQDINSILYQNYNSRLHHTYSKIGHKSKAKRQTSITSSTSMDSAVTAACSDATDATSATYLVDDLVDLSELSRQNDRNSTAPTATLSSLYPSISGGGFGSSASSPRPPQPGTSTAPINSFWAEPSAPPTPDGENPPSRQGSRQGAEGAAAACAVNFGAVDFSLPISYYFGDSLASNTTASTSLDSINSAESIFELDEGYQVIPQGKIGQGFYGDVYKAIMEHLGQQEIEPTIVAIKKIKPNAIASSLQDFEREVDIMKPLEHPNIVQILGVLRDPEPILVMEFVQHGSLHSYLKINKERLRIKQLLKFSLDIAEGMHYLGTKNIVHRDLAARNILVADENHVKISDFGLAQFMNANNYYILKTYREVPIKWYALESLRDFKYSARSDVWSYGVTMCEMFNYGEEPSLASLGEEITKVEPARQTIALIAALESGARFPNPPNCPLNIYIRIIYPCWKENPHERIRFSELINEINDLLTDYVDE